MHLNVIRLASFRLHRKTSLLVTIALFIGACSSIAWRWMAGRGREPTQSVRLFKDEYRIISPEHPCGPVSVCSISHLLKKPTKLETAMAAIPIDSYGRTTMHEMTEGIRVLGFACAAVRLQPGAIEHISEPFIILTTYSHYIAVVSTSDTMSLVLVDPPNHVSVVSVNEMAADWKGEAILVARDETDLKGMLNRIGITSFNGPDASQ